MVVAWSLLTITILLVIAGVGLYYSGMVGWAQMLWVMASGTAGASVIAFVDRR